MVGTNFYVFTEPDALDIQNSSEAFGPIDTGTYRLNSLHKARSVIRDNANLPGLKAYSVCDGHIRIQKNHIDPDLINIIIRPTTVDFFGMNVKYFIYRGILKNSLIDSNGKLKPPGAYLAGIGPNDENYKYVMDYAVWGDDYIESFYSKLTDLPNLDNLDTLGMCFNAETSDVSLKREDSDLISSIFFESTKNPPLLGKKGFYLGDFDKNKIGFEVIASGNREEPTLAIARNIATREHKFPSAIEHLLQINSSNIPDINEQRFYREDILNYIDPCAFFGSLISHSQIVFTRYYSFKINTDDNSDGRPATADSDYSSTASTLSHGRYCGNDTEMSLEGFGAIFSYFFRKFYNKDKIYLDIRNENNFSLNFYDDYNDNNVLSYDFDYSSPRSNQPLPPLITSVGYETNSWPIKIFTNSEININYPPSYPHDFGVTALRFTLSIGNETYSSDTKRFLYVSHAGQFLNDNGSFENTIYSNQINDKFENYKSIPDYSFSFKQRFKLFPTLRDDNGMPKVRQVFLSIPVGKYHVLLNEPDIDVFLPIYNKLVYCKQFKNTSNLESVVNTYSEFDNIHEVKDYKNYIKWQPGESTLLSYWWLTGNEKFIQRTSSDSLVLQTCVVEQGVAIEKTLSGQNDRIIFFTMPICLLDSDFTSNYLSNERNKIMNVANGGGSFFRNFQLNISSSNDDKTLMLVKNSANVLEYQMGKGFGTKDPRTILCLTLTLSEYNTIKTTSSEFNANYHPVYLKTIRQTDYGNSVRDLKLQLIGLDANRTTLIIDSITVKGKTNIYSSQAAYDIEPSDLVDDKDFRYIHLSSDPQIQSEDLSLFKEARNLLELHLLKGFAGKRNKEKSRPTYQKIINFIQHPHKIITHDYRNNGPINHYYPYDIIFNNSDTGADAGSTKVVEYFKGPFFPNDNLDSESPLYLKFEHFALSNSAAKPSYSDFPIQEAEDISNIGNPKNLHNYYIYFKSNLNSQLPPSSFNDTILYRTSDRKNALSVDKKIYLEGLDIKSEALQNLSPAEISQIKSLNIPAEYLKNLTIEEATTLGYCQAKSFQTELFRLEFSHYKDSSGIHPIPDKFIYTNLEGVEVDPTNPQRIGNGIRPEVYKMAKTLLHEMGHALATIENPVDDWIWGKLDEFYCYTQSIPPDSFQILDEDNCEAHDYPNLTGANAALRKKSTCQNAGFIFKYGSGHLKGSLSGNEACNSESNFIDWMNNQYPVNNSASVPGPNDNYYKFYVLIEESTIKNYCANNLG